MTSISIRPAEQPITDEDLHAYFDGLPQARLEAAQEARLRQGQALKISGLQPGLCAVLSHDGAVIGLATADGENLRPLRLTSG